MLSKILTPLTFATMVALAADPASAGIVPTPAPVLGGGVGALAVLGLGYYALRRRRS